MQRKKAEFKRCKAQKAKYEGRNKSHLPGELTNHHMGKKMKLIPFLSKADPKPSPSPSWQWPSCGNIKTLSFRASSDDIRRMANSTFAIEPPDICFTSSSSLAESSGSFSTVSEEEHIGAGDSVEMVIRGLRSERLFYEPGETSSILEANTKSTSNNKSNSSNNNNNDDTRNRCEVVSYKESLVMSMDSKDPYADFRRSMEEMVEAHGLKDWEGLEELLGWYLRINVKSNHGYIVGAYIDLLVSLSFAAVVGESSSSSASSSFTISHSSLPSSLLSLPSSLSTAPPSLSQLLDQGEGENRTRDSVVLS